MRIPRYYWTIGVILVLFVLPKTVKIEATEQQGLQKQHETSCFTANPEIVGPLSSYRHARPANRLAMANKYPKESNTTRIITVGLPKAGTTSTTNFLRKACKIQTCDHVCNSLPVKAQVQNYSMSDGPFRSERSNGTRYRYIANCIRDAVQVGLPPLTTCGNFVAYGQLDVVWSTRPEVGCYFPQIQALERIIDENPDAVLLLNMRNATEWAHSTQNWYGSPGRGSNQGSAGVSLRMTLCDEGPASESTLNMTAWYCQHIKRIRAIAQRYSKTLTLIEFDIASPDTEDRLKNFFDITKDGPAWTIQNVNTVGKTSNNETLQANTSEV